MRTIGWKFYLVFISVTVVAFVWAYFAIKETKGLPLEEIAALFGEQDEVTVFAANIHMDHTNHEVIVDEIGEYKPGPQYQDKGLHSETKAESETSKHIEG